MVLFSLGDGRSKALKEGKSTKFQVPWQVGILGRLERGLARKATVFVFFFGGFFGGCLKSGGGLKKFH